MHQKINEFEQGTKRVVYDDYFHRDDIYYEISCVYELLNGNLVSGNSYGLKIYEKFNHHNIFHKYIYEV